ncbi:hypothetical protein JCM1840_006090 [Sporobolomyces johnsonii]
MLQVGTIVRAIARSRTLATSAAPKPSLRVVRPTTEEISSGALSQRNLQKSLEALHLDGIVALEGVVPHDALDKLNDRMLKDTRALVAMGDDGWDLFLLVQVILNVLTTGSAYSPFNYNKGNIQQDPPVEVEVFHPQIFFNPLATAVTSAFLGGKPTLSFLSGNTAVQSTEGLGQPVHTDADFEHPKIPFACVVNVGLVDMRPENGSTELWLGTHTDSGLHVQEGLHGERASGRILPALLEARREVSPPLQPFVPKGSLVIRDLRLWHAGRPNLTPAPRIMLASIHFAPWYRQRMTLRLPSSLRSLIEGKANEQNLDIAAEWVEGRVDPLEVKFGNAYDFGQDE